MWQCSQCGDCCRLIVIPVQEDVDIETIGYLEAHGIGYKDGRVIIPAVCKYLVPPPLPSPSGGGSKGEGTKYKCGIHECKFANCRLAGEKECKGTQEDLECLQNLKHLED